MLGSPSPAMLCWWRGTLSAKLSPDRQGVDVLYTGRQRQRLPGVAAILGPIHFAFITRTQVNLVGVAVMQRNGHDGAMHLHLVETFPRRAFVGAAVDAAVLAGC